MVFSVSPSVTVREVDLTTSVPAITTPPAAIAGVFRWGPINERILVTSENELASIFGPPSDFNAETFFSAADFLSYSNALYVTRVVSDTATKATEGGLTPYFRAKHLGALANDIDIAYVSVSDAQVGDNNNTNFEAELFDTSVFAVQNLADITDYTGLSGTPSRTLPFGSNVMVFSITTNLAATSLINPDPALKVGDVIRFGNSDVGYQELTVTAFPTPVVTEELDRAGNDVTIFTHTITFDRNYTLTETAAEMLEITRKWRYASLFDTAPATGDFHIAVIDRVGKISGQAGTVLERFSNMSTSPTARFSDGSNRYYAEVIRTGSAWIEATSNLVQDIEETGYPLTNAVKRAYISLTGGVDGANEESIALGPIARGYDLYKEANDVDISLVIQGKSSPNLATYLISNIAEYRKDCMLFLSPPKTSVVGVASPQAQLTNILAYRNGLQNSSYWFMDSGYKYRYDKYNDTFRWVPLNGDMAGLSALVQPWESPAGYRKGRVRNAVKLAFNPNKPQRDQLYGKDINPVIAQAGQGTILFGDKTGFGTSTGSAFTRVNVRRLFITIEKAIATISAQLLFEFNDEFTQNQFRQIVDPFLRDIQGRRGIIDFRVVSDATINNPQVVDSGTFRANIFIKPARSINFVELTFVATRTGVEFEEIVGQDF